MDTSVSKWVRYIKTTTKVQDDAEWNIKVKYVNINKQGLIKVT